MSDKRKRKEAKRAARKDAASRKPTRVVRDEHGHAHLSVVQDALGNPVRLTLSRPLFTEDFQLIVSSMHPLAARPKVAVDALKEERLMLRPYCETTAGLLEVLRAREFDVARFHEVSADGDLISLLEAGVGIALMPRSTQSPPSLVRITVDDFEVKRTVYLYGVAGRQRTAVAAAMMKMLRAYDWSRFAAA